MERQERFAVGDHVGGDVGGQFAQELDHPYVFAVEIAGVPGLGGGRHDGR